MRLKQAAFVAAVLLAIGGFAGGSAAALPLVFTGNAAVDFAVSGTLFFPDVIGGVGDVGLSGGGFSNPVNPSGFDFVGIYLNYDFATDVLYIGFDTYGIAGDSNGDGNPFDEGTATGKIDFTETMILAIDLDGNANHLTATYEALVGVDFFAIDVGEVGLLSPSVGFPAILFTNINPGTTSATISQMYEGNDFEIAVSGFGQYVLGVTPSPDVEFSFNAFSDAGRGGEDILGAQTYKVPEPGTLIAASSAVALLAALMRNRMRSRREKSRQAA
jgi:hypothetical protein